MRFIKFFFEEPAAMELLTPDLSSEARAPTESRSLEEFLAAPAYYRGYCAGTDLARPATGLTSLPERIWKPLLQQLAGPGKWLKREGQSWVECGLDGGWTANSGEIFAVSASADLPPWSDAEDGRRALAAIRGLIDAGATVLVAEPAPDGVDWALYGSRPFSGKAREAMMSVPEARCYVIPLRQARGEHRFYFERHDPESFRQFEVQAG